MPRAKKKSDKKEPSTKNSGANIGYEAELWKMANMLPDSVAPPRTTTLTSENTFDADRRLGVEIHYILAYSLFSISGSGSEGLPETRGDLPIGPLASARMLRSSCNRLDVRFSQVLSRKVRRDL